MHQREMNCVYCESKQIVKNGKNQSGGKQIQRYLCKECGKGLEVAMKVKGSQGKPQIEWLKQEHPFTAISPKSDVHANHNEAQNSSLRRRASGYRRRQNLYAKTVEGLRA
jgi:DNA-directed RNA polymerase subunit RPC12/RpoP